METDTKFGTYRFSRGAVIICVYRYEMLLCLLFVGWLCCNLIALFGPPHDRGYFMTLALSNKDATSSKGFFSVAVNQGFIPFYSPVHKLGTEKTPALLAQGSVGRYRWVLSCDLRMCAWPTNSITNLPTTHFFKRIYAIQMRCFINP